MNVSNITMMFEKFSESNLLKISDLLSIGFSDDDVYSMVNCGFLKQSDTIYYSLSDDVEDYIIFSKYLHRQKMCDVEISILEKWLEVDPCNKDVNVLLLFSLVFTDRYDDIYKCLDVLLSDENTGFARKREYNYWLYLMSFIKDVPDKYKDKVRNMTFDNVSVSNDDNRFDDVANENRIRALIMRKKFGKAYDFMDGKYLKGSSLSVISYKLCSLARKSYRDTTNELLGLVFNFEFEEILKKLDEIGERQGLSVTEKAIYCMSSDLIGIVNDGVVPEINGSDSLDIINLILNHNYRKAMYLSKQAPSDAKRNKMISMLLDKVNYELDKLELDEEKQEFSGKFAIDEDREKQLFARITSHLMRYDVDSAFELLDEYLNMVDCLEYKRYICDLIKLSILNKEKGFVEAMHSLSLIARGEYEFDVSHYIQDYYFSLVDKDFKKAAIYLDVVALSHTIGGIYIDISDMREALIDTMKKNGIDPSEEGIVIPDVMEEVEYIPKKRRVVVSKNDTGRLDDSVSTNTINDKDVDLIGHFSETVEVDSTDVLETTGDVILEEETLVEDASLNPTQDVTSEDDDFIYTIPDIIEEVLENSNLIMLDAMSDEEVSTLLSAVEGISKIQSKVIDSNGEKHVILRYYDKDGPYVDIPRVLKEAGRRYSNWEYVAAINLYQSVLPKLAEPRAFIYKNLGFAYQKTAYDGDYSKAIDYLTMAMEQSKNEVEKLDFTDTIEGLKKKCNYNGVRVDREDAGYQYKKN